MRFLIVHISSASHSQENWHQCRHVRLNLPDATCTLHLPSSALWQKDKRSPNQQLRPRASPMSQTWTTRSSLTPPIKQIRASPRDTSPSTKILISVFCRWIMNCCSSDNSMEMMSPCDHKQDDGVSWWTVVELNGPLTGPYHPSPSPAQEIVMMMLARIQPDMSSAPATHHRHDVCFLLPLVITLQASSYGTKQASSFWYFTWRDS